MGSPPPTRPNQEVTALTKNSMALNRTLFLQDNLPVLRGLDTDSIDLIATDPPFNKGVPAFKGTTKAGQNVEFKDVWNWDDDVHVEWTNAILGKHPSLYSTIDAANRTAGHDMGAFLCWMAVRVLEMHRVLKPTGSMYLHCDPTASHYLKAMMDAIFGRKQFRNEIVWGYPASPSAAKRDFPRKHDTILRYSKGQEWTFNADAVRVPYADSSMNRIQYAANASTVMRGETIKLHGKGKIPPTVWTDIQQSYRYRSEHTGYPTQKPLALYKRMIEASSNPGDMVLDPFAGCATTCVAAEQLGRQWIGIDIQEESGDVIRERLENEVNESMAWNDIVRTPTTAPERTDGGEPVTPELAVVGRKWNARRISVSKLRGELIDRDGLRCQGCGWEPHHADYLQVDHNKPKSLEGSDDMDNLALLCDPCNRKKSNKLTIHQLREERASEPGWMNMDWWKEEKWKR